MMNSEVIRGLDMISGRGMFDGDHYCSYISEQLFKFLGDNSREKLDRVVAAEDMTQFLDTFGKATVYKKQIAYIKIKRADDIYRMCRISIKKRHNGMYEVEIVDIDRACEQSLTLLEETEKMRYVAAKQEFVMFEYFFDSGKIEIYGFNEALKVDFSGDRSYDILKKYISRDARKMNESTSPFILKKTYTIGDAKYTVKGNVILRDSDRYETIGLVIANGDEDSSFEGGSNTHDAATGLYNKPHSLVLARKAVNLKKNKQILLVMIDIDDFKVINDTYGHMFGDEVLKKLALILRESAMNRGFAGRFGGDEFFMCLYDIGTENDLRALLQDIYYRLKTAFADRDINITCSIGIAEYPRNGRDFDILMKKADRGLYIAKYKGKNRFIIYKENIHGELNEDGKLHEVCMRENINRKQMLNGIKDCFLMIMRECDNLEMLNTVMKKVIDIYDIDGISIYAGNGFHKLYEFGTYTEPLENAGYLYNHNIVALFSEEGIYYEKSQYMRNTYQEELHRELKTHSIATTMQCIIGSKTHMKGVVTFDKERYEKNWSDEEMSLAMILSSMLACSLKL